MFFVSMLLFCIIAHNLSDVCSGINIEGSIGRIIGGILLSDVGSGYIPV